MRKFILTLLFATLAASVHARGVKDTLTTPTFSDYGETAQMLKVTVGTTTPVKVWTPDITKRDRSIVVANPSANYELRFSTSPNFYVDDLWFFIAKGSITLSLQSETTYYFGYPPGASSETVRGVKEMQ